MDYETLDKDIKGLKETQELYKGQRRIVMVTQANSMINQFYIFTK